MASLLAVQFILYFVMSAYEEVKPLWKETITEYCPGQYHETAFFMNGSLRRIALSFTGYGLYIGLLINT